MTKHEQIIKISAILESLKDQYNHTYDKKLIDKIKMNKKLLRKLLRS